jgi:hypothetical protein
MLFLLLNVMLMFKIYIFWSSKKVAGVTGIHVSPFWALPRRRLFMADYWAYRLEDQSVPPLGQN